MSGTVEPALIARFAAIYAEAVLTYLDAREAQWVTWDGADGFDFSSVELDPPEDPVLLHVDESWHQLVGDLDAVSDPDADRYDPEALRAAIEHEIVEEGLGERVLKLYAEQRAKGLEEDEASDED